MSRALLASALLALAPSLATASGSHIDEVLPFSAALEAAQAQHRLIFLKPVYGGVDEAGAKDYCDGTW